MLHYCDSVTRDERFISHIGSYSHKVSPTPSIHLTPFSASLPVFFLSRLVFPSLASSHLPRHATWCCRPPIVVIMSSTVVCAYQRFHCPPPSPHPLPFRYHHCFLPPLPLPLRPPTLSCSSCHAFTLPAFAVVVVVVGAACLCFGRVSGTCCCCCCFRRCAQHRRSHPHTRAHPPSYFGQRIRSVSNRRVLLD